jgi:hypothetical protein
MFSYPLSVDNAGVGRLLPYLHSCPGAARMPFGVFVLIAKKELHDQFERLFRLVPVLAVKQRA